MTPATVGTALLRATLDSAIWIAALALVTHLVPRIPARVRCGLWWLASVKALLACLMLPAAALPVPARMTRPVLAPVARVAESARATLPAIVLPHAIPPVAAASPAGLAPWHLLPLALLVLWAAGVLVIAARLLCASLDLRARWRAATPLESPLLRGGLATWLGAERAAAIELRTSPAVSAPLVLGGRRGRILLPESCRDGDVAQARMALAHEATHLVRGDLLWAWIPALAECVFWFHPLLRWSVREYVQAREEACDAQALRWSGAEPEGYGEMLVGFGARSPRLGHAVSCGSPHVRHLLRRLRMLGPSARPGRTERVVALAALIVFGATAIVPIRLVFARDHATAASPREPVAGAVAGSAREPAQVVSEHTDVTPARSVTTVGGTSAGPGYASVSRRESASSTYSDDGDGHSFSYGLVTGGGAQFSGSLEESEWPVIRRLQEREHGRVFWFHVDGQDYLVRDPDAIRQVDDALEPLDRLGERQSKLGDQQSRLGDRQSELGDRQSALGDRESELSDRESDLRSRLAEDDVSESDREKIHRELAKIEAQRAELSQMQGELGHLQGELGAEQGELGRQQGELGQLQGKVAKQIRHDLQELGRKWIDEGQAEPVR